MRRRLAALLGAAVLVLPAMAGDYTLGNLTISHPWSRATAPGMPMGVAYLAITNRGKAADALVAASTPAAAQVEIHQTTLSDGMARMRPVQEVVIAPGSTVKIEPGGIHLMLVGLKQPLSPLDTVPLTLRFRDAGEITIQLSIESP
ncbi:MAG TPA: copper chaperone PCu(A)C [Steroidobacteraceae bacterium]|jgi:copper(I)-binding protein|nr:copper chaperone PCu(A)C [Steroidobacteraceae bacterium]